MRSLHCVCCRWTNYTPAWDFNCCIHSYALHEQHWRTLRTHLRADLGPLPRYRTEAEYDEHLARARVVHVTALSQPWRKRDSRRFGIMRKVANLVLGRANASHATMTPPQAACVERAAEHFLAARRGRTGPASG